MELELHPDPVVVARLRRHEPIGQNELATIRQRAALIADELLGRTEREAKAGAAIIFWGEGNAFVLKEDEGDMLARGQALAKHYGLYLGMALATWDVKATRPLENKIVLLQPNGLPAWEYLKTCPVPGREAATSRKGDGKIRVLPTNDGRLSAAICFDADFPRLIAQAGQLEADIVLDPSNDWRAIDPWHTRMASFRAIEQGFNLVRQTSHGLSAAYDYQGRQLAAMDHFKTEDKTLIAQVPTRGSRTLYRIAGDWFGWLACASLLLLSFRSLAAAPRLR